MHLARRREAAFHSVEVLRETVSDGFDDTSSECEAGLEPSPSRRCQEGGRIIVFRIAAGIFVLAVAAVLAAIAATRRLRPVATDGALMFNSVAPYQCEWPGGAGESANAAVEWSDSRLFYCCSHYPEKAYCQYLKDKVSLTFVLSNVMYDSIRTEFYSKLRNAIVVDTIQAKFPDVKPADITVTTWKGSSLHSTVAEYPGLVVRVQIAKAGGLWDKIDATLRDTALWQESINKWSEDVHRAQKEWGGHEPLSEAPGLDVKVEDLTLQKQLFHKCTCPEGIEATDVSGENACPFTGGEVCVDCNPGFALTADKTCKQNECQCAHGIAALGKDCPKDGDYVCSRCKPGFHMHHHDLLAGAEISWCMPNTCKCSSGIEAKGEHCLFDNEQQCASCLPGFYLDEYRICQPTTCRCTNGKEAKGPACARNGAYVCSECNPGFHLDEAKGCSLNTCTCWNGHRAVGELCSEDGAEMCASCAVNSSWLYHQETKTCGPKRCDCPNGEAETGEACVTHGSITCRRCNLGFRLNAKQCVAGGCTCEHGTAVTGPHCAFGSHICESCASGYYKTKDNKCVRKECYCPHGVPAEGELCRIQGAESCQRCHTGYHIDVSTAFDKGIWKTLVSCVPNKCTCDGGEAATGDTEVKCNVNGANICNSCHAGFRMTWGMTSRSNRSIGTGEVSRGHQCRPNICDCRIGERLVGRPVPNENCAIHGAQNCSECYGDYFLASAPLADYEDVAGHLAPAKEVFKHNAQVCVFNRLTTTMPFDCRSGAANWEAAWSPMKKRWCCSTDAKFCTPTKTQADLCQGEGRGYSPTQCKLIGCCAVNERNLCVPATDGSALCHPVFNLRTTTGKCFNAAVHHLGLQTTMALTVKLCDLRVVGEEWKPAVENNTNVVKDTILNVCFAVVIKQSIVDGVLRTLTVEEITTAENDDHENDHDHDENENDDHEISAPTTTKTTTTKTTTTKTTTTKTTTTKTMTTTTTTLERLVTVQTCAGGQAQDISFKPLVPGASKGQLVHAETQLCLTEGYGGTVKAELCRAGDGMQEFEAREVR